MKKPIAITLGDCAGIGPEIIVKAFRDAPEDTHRCFVVGDVAVMRRAVRVICDGQVPLPVVVIESAAEALAMPPRCIPVIQVGVLAEMPVLGQLNAHAGRLAAESVVWAAQAALRGEVAAMVTAPLNKEALALAGPPHSSYPGHTEMLQSLAAGHSGQSLSGMPVRMMLANEELRTVLVSIHVSLREALDAITFERVLQTLRISVARGSKFL